MTAEKSHRQVVITATHDLFCATVSGGELVSFWHACQDLFANSTFWGFQYHESKSHLPDDRQLFLPASAETIRLRCDQPTIVSSCNPNIDWDCHPQPVHIRLTPIIAIDTENLSVEMSTPDYNKRYPAQTPILNGNFKNNDKFKTSSNADEEDAVAVTKDYVGVWYRSKDAGEKQYGEWAPVVYIDRKTGIDKVTGSMCTKMENGGF